MIHLILDGALGMDAIHDRVARELHFPRWYGRNLDALYDCLTEVPEDVRLVLINREALGARGEALLHTILDAARCNPHLLPDIHPEAENTAFFD